MVAIKWAMSNGGLDVSIYETLHQAADAAERKFNAGQESLRHIECEGALYTIDWVLAWAEQKQEFHQQMPPLIPVTHRIEVESPDRGWAVYTYARSTEDAERKAADFIYALGRDRVRIVPHP